MRNKTKKFLILGITIFLLCLFYFLAQKISPDDIKEFGLGLPLPVLTFIIALVNNLLAYNTVNSSG